MKPIFSRLLIAATAVLATSLVQAQAVQSQNPDETAPPAPMHEHHHGFGMRDPMMGFFADKLDLTDAQKDQMKTIMQKERPTVKPLYQQSRQIQRELRQFEQGTYDEAKVRTLASQQAQVQTELTVQRTRLHSELFQVLTPEQQAKVKEFEAKRAARIQARGQRNAAPPAQDQQ